MLRGTKSTAPNLWISPRVRIRVGFVPMIDCAPLLVAAELKLFERYGVPVELKTEVGWATVREKLLHGEIEAAHAPASMAYAIHCGIGVVPRPCLTGLVLNLNGNAITLSNELWDLGVRDAATLKALIERERGRRMFTFASVLELSSQNYILRQWLRSGGIDPDRDVRLIVIPSRLVHENLGQGYVDGYCVAEPWNSILLVEQKAWVVKTCSEIDPLHPEKVLLVLQEFATKNHDLHMGILAALIDACVFCEEPANRRELVRILAMPKYLNVPAPILENSLLENFNTGRQIKPSKDLIIFNRHNANIPSRAKARWVYDEIESNGLAQNCLLFRRDVMRKIFRKDLYLEALELAKQRGNPRGSSSPMPSSGPTPATEFPSPFTDKLATSLCA